MSAHPPPVPPEQRSDKGSGAADISKPGKAAAAATSGDRNLAEQGRQGNSKQNTTNEGLQQDR
jgi:hypothetical protein